MQNSQPANPTITKLLEADADLAAQEAELNAQLQSIGEKRRSLKTVIDMFVPAPTADTVPVATPAQPPVDEEQSQPTAPDDVLSELDGAMTDAPKASAPQPQKQQGKKNSSSASTKQSKKSTPVKKSSKAPDTWHEYVKDDFSNISLAEAVSKVMQQHPKQVLEIATIIDNIFVNEIPKEIRSTARERVSNVLSVGAKKGDWYRGQLGKYSMSESAVKG
ncbi:hypothetical protein [Aliterella atlantica]|uniref:Uncharacterized protein n=1 Tax=Aliterella atlantica CENA595 TaxID=1618023 RepID=A0A0D8ZLG9_9CYAN|nr:hypothetical protein [Aliterella atlantica]KJH69585.1 hypothetical protein UH38_22870 [Aliterella atlantica CENA595]